MRNQHHALLQIAPFECGEERIADLVAISVGCHT
jgi:hypothetical protein